MLGNDAASVNGEDLPSEIGLLDDLVETVAASFIDEDV
jgi:hypothetical protein